MTLVTYVDDVYASLRRLSRLGAEVVSRQPDQRHIMTGYIVDTLRQQLIATNKLRASCEEHLSNVNQIQAVASQVCLCFP